nr:hypothetical protein [Streptomyces sp. NRRL S-37]
MREVLVRDRKAEVFFDLLKQLDDFHRIHTEVLFQIRLKEAVR